MTAAAPPDPRPSAPGPDADRAELAAGGLVRLLGVLLGVAVLVLAGAFLAYQRNEMVATQNERNALLARLLEDHATRSFESASLALTTLGDFVVGDEGARAGGASLQAALGQTLVNLPFLRSLAVLDTDGRVIASTARGEAGQRIDIARLGALPPEAGERIGEHVAGRGLLDLQPGSNRVVPAGLGFIPMMRLTAPGASGRRLLVALVNPDALANYQQQAIDDADRSAMLVSYAGRVLAATTTAGIVPGDDLHATVLFREQLPGREHGVYLDTERAEGAQLVAFRSSRSRALVVVVEQAEAAVLARWEDIAGWVGGAAAAAITFIAAATLLASRSQRQRERARQERDAAQAEVVRREHELSVIVGSVQELLFRTDVRGRLTFVSPRWAITTGRALEALRDEPLAALVVPEDRAAVQALFSAGLPPSARTTPAAVVAADGRVRRYEIAVVPLEALTGATGYAGSAVDVTERWAAQQRLQAQLGFTAQLLETNPLPMSMLDREGRYLTVNQAWEAYMGRERGAVLGRPASGLQRPQERLLHDAQDRHLLEHGGQVRYEAPFRHRDGQMRDLLVSKAAVPGDDGRPMGVLVAFMDITELRAAERATREARDAAEEASRAKSEFIANISHELRTPLQAILGFSELGMVRGRAHERLASMFGDIHAAGQRMLALVNDLLDVAKIESTVGAFNLERLDLRDLAAQVLRELDPLLGPRSLRIDSRLGEVPLGADADPLRMQQVLRNVLANAIKFSPPASAIVLSGRLDGDEVELAVRDHGPGVPEDELERIFEAFVQSSTTKDGSGGTGLGLAISRKIVSGHGGSIRAENAEGGGARFVIRLPARPAHRLAAPLEAGAA